MMFHHSRFCHRQFQRQIAAAEQWQQTKKKQRRPVLPLVGWQPALWLAAMLVLLVGCGSKVEMAPVSGTVTLNGKPVGNLLVIFHPEAVEGSIEAPTRPAMATADDQGRFELSTKVQGDGAAVGKHRVSVAAASGETPPPGRLPRDYQVEVKPGQNEFNLELIADT